MACGGLRRGQSEMAVTWITIRFCMLAKQSELGQAEVGGEKNVLIYDLRSKIYRSLILIKYEAYFSCAI